MVNSDAGCLMRITESYSTQHSALRTLYRIRLEGHVRHPVAAYRIGGDDLVRARELQLYLRLAMVGAGHDIDLLAQMARR